MHMIPYATVWNPIGFRGWEIKLGIFWDYCIEVSGILYDFLRPNTDLGRGYPSRSPIYNF